MYAARIYLRHNAATQTTRVYVEGDVLKATSLELPQLPPEERITILDMCDNARSMRKINDRVAGKQPTMASNTYHLIGEYRHEYADNSITAVTYPAGEVPATSPTFNEQSSPRTASNNSCVQVMSSAQNFMAIRQAIGVIDTTNTQLNTAEGTANFFENAHTTCLFTKRTFDQKKNTDSHEHHVTTRVDALPVQQDEHGNAAEYLYTQTYDALFGNTAHNTTTQNIQSTHDTQSNDATITPNLLHNNNHLVHTTVQQLSQYQLGEQYGVPLLSTHTTSMPAIFVPLESYTSYSFTPEQPLQDIITAERHYLAPDCSASQKDYDQYIHTLAAQNATKYDKSKIKVQLHQLFNDYLTCTVDGLPINLAVHIPLKPKGNSVKEQLLMLERMRWNLTQLNEVAFAALVLCQSEEEFASEYAKLLYALQAGSPLTSPYWIEVQNRYNALRNSPKARQQLVRCYDLYQFPGFQQLLRHCKKEYDEHILELAAHLPHCHKKEFATIWGMERQPKTWVQKYLFPFVYIQGDKYPFRDFIRAEATRIEQEQADQFHTQLQEVIALEATRDIVLPQTHNSTDTIIHDHTSLPAEVVFIEELITATTAQEPATQLLHEWALTAHSAYEQADDATFTRYYNRVAQVSGQLAQEPFAPSSTVLQHGNEQQFPACLLLEHGGTVLHKTLQREALSELQRGLTVQRQCTGTFYLHDTAAIANTITTIALGHIYEENVLHASHLLDLSACLTSMCEQELRDYGTTRDIGAHAADFLLRVAQRTTGILKDRLPQLLKEIPLQLIAGTALTSTVNALLPGFIVAKIAILSGIALHQLLAHIKQYHATYGKDPIQANAQLTADIIECVLVGKAVHLLSRDGGFFKRCIQDIHNKIIRQEAVAGLVSDINPSLESRVSTKTTLNNPLTNDATVAAQPLTTMTPQVAGLVTEFEALYKKDPKKALELLASLKERSRVLQKDIATKNAASSCVKKFLTREEVAQIKLKPNNEASLLTLNKKNTDHFHIFGNQTSADGLNRWTKHKWAQTGKIAEELSQQLVTEIKATLVNGNLVVPIQGGEVIFTVQIEGYTVTVRGYVHPNMREFSVGTAFIE